MVCEFDRNVSVVFHAAATVRFDEPLRNAVLLNTRGTRELLALAKDMTNLKVTLSLSSICLFYYPTAYSFSECARHNKAIPLNAV